MKLRAIWMGALLLALPLTGLAEDMSRESVDGHLRPAMIQGCHKHAQNDPNMKDLGSALDIDSYCGCTYDEMTRDMSGEEVMLMFLTLGQARKTGKPTPTKIQEHMSNSAALCLVRQMGASGEFREALVGKCVSGFTEKSLKESPLPEGKTPEMVCGCVLDKVMSLDNTEGVQLLMRAGLQSQGKQDMSAEDEARLTLYALSCALGDSKK